MEKVVIALGLNNENLREQPPELASSFGTGLHLWQYPIQMGRYLSFLAAHAEANSYVEIGSRWGGTLIAVCETLRHNCKGCLKRIVAVDPVGETPLLIEYRAYLLIHSPEVVLDFYKGLSSAPSFKQLMLSFQPSYVFIDGDHRYMAAQEDHELADAAGEWAPSATIQPGPRSIHFH
jgi:cephalosporin hydroxylase